MSSLLVDMIIPSVNGRFDETSSVTSLDHVDLTVSDSEVMVQEELVAILVRFSPFSHINALLKFTQHASALRPRMLQEIAERD